MHYITTRRTVLAIILGATAMTAGCKPKESGRPTDTSAAATKGPVKVPASSVPTSTDSSTIAPLSDANIEALHDEVNAGDSALAALALPRLTNADVKAFARMMLREHHALHAKGVAMAKAQHIRPELSTVDPFKSAVGAEQDALNKTPKGLALDSAYIADEIGIHQMVMQWAIRNVPQNRAMKQYVQSAAPVFQKHLTQALALQKKLGKQPGS